MNGLGGEFLAGAGLALNQDGGAGRCDAAKFTEDLVHLRAVADNALEAEFLVELAFQLTVGAGQAQALRDLVHDGPKFGHVYRLRQIVRRSFLDGFDGGLHVAVAGDDDHLGVGQILLGLAENGEAVHVLHAQVGEDDVEFVMLDLARPGLAAGGDDALIASDALQTFGNRLGVARFVVDDQDAQAVGAFGFAVGC